MKRVAGPALTTSDPAKMQTPARELTDHCIIAKHDPLRNIGKGNFGSHRQILTALRMVFQIERGLPMASPQNNHTKAISSSRSVGFFFLA
ncbi:hypothetical protein ACC771_13505, partial [Rhizobium ruizarguesonis]